MALLLWASAPNADDAPDGRTLPAVHAASSIETGRYLITVAGCNDCHTVDWAETNGAVPEAEWLAGVPIGWRGPWGTTYASNLRLLVHEITEDAWVAMLRVRSDRPPMPWMNVNKMSEVDARSIYRFIRSLGLRGQRMPAAVDFGIEPETPYFNLEPAAPADRNVALTSPPATPVRD